jgi:two-component system nitrate/nitrite response regulator NarL
MSAVRSSPIRVLLIDDHAVVRTGLRLLIESHSGLQIVGEAKNRSEALANAAEKQPDVIVLDLNLGDENALDFLPELLTAAGAARVLVLTAMPDPELHRRAVKLGVVGIVLKEQAADVLLRAIEKVHAGEVWLERAMIAHVLGQMTRHQSPTPLNPEEAKIATLSVREYEVIALIGEGLKNSQIAKRLFISESTVRHHLTSIFNKLGVHDRLELVIYAYQHGLVAIPR